MRSASSAMSNVSCNRLSATIYFIKKEIFDMKYALAEFSAHIYGDRTFMVGSDHDLLLPAVNSPHLLQK